MAKCPKCHSSYPGNTTTCPVDGTVLLHPGSVPLEAFGQVGLTTGGEPSTDRRSTFFSRGDLAFGDLSTRILDDSIDEDLESMDLTVRGTGIGAAAALGANPISVMPVTKLTAIGKSNARPRGADMPSTRVSMIEDMPSKVATGDEAVDRLGESLGSYKLKRIIGRGGMGCVYEAEHVKLGRPVALKVLNSDYARRRDAVARFFQEARAVNQIRHRNIVDITDLVETDDGTTFIIMELLDGVNLTQLMGDGRLAMERAISILVQICDALEAAHAKNIVHRDLKPDNIVIVKNHAGEEQVKLLDFGVAKLLNPDHAEGLTAAGAVVGTPAFMSPEQSAGLNVDRRSDIYSLGAIMYELFCEQPMFRGKSFGEYVRKHLEERPLEPSRSAGGDRIDERLEAIIMRCLEKSPDARYQTAGELKAELMERLSEEDVSRVSLLTGVSDPSLDTQTETVRDAMLIGDDLSADVLEDEETVVAAQAINAYVPDWASAHGIGHQTAMVFGDVPNPRPRPRGRWLWIGGVAALAAVAVISVVAAATSGATNNKNMSAAAGELDRKPDVEPIPAKTNVDAPKTRAVEIHSTPSGSLYAAGDEDNVICHNTPCVIHVPVSEKSNAFNGYVIRRTGYQDERFTIQLAEPPDRVDLALKSAFTEESSSQDELAQDAGTSDSGAETTSDTPEETSDSGEPGSDKTDSGKAGKGSSKGSKNGSGKSSRGSSKGSKSGSGRASRGSSKGSKNGDGKSGDGKSIRGKDKYGREIPGYDPFE